MPKASESKSPWIWVLVFAVAGFLMIMNFGYVLRLMPFVELETAPGIRDSVNYTVDDNWDTEGSYMGLVTDGDSIWVEANQVGNWTSEIIDVPRNRVLRATYTADMTGGVGNLTVRAWTDEPNGDPADQIRTIELQSGTFTEQFNFSEYNYFEAELKLREDAGNQNTLPEVSYLNLEYVIVEGQQEGLDESEQTMVLFLLLTFVFFVLISQLFYIFEQ